MIQVIKETVFKSSLGSLVFSFVLLSGCGSEDQPSAASPPQELEERDYGAELNQVYLAFQQHTGEASKHYFAALESIRQKSKQDVLKADVVSPKLSTIDLEYAHQPIGGKYVHLENMTFIGDFPDREFKDHQDLTWVEKMATQPLSSFLPPRCRRFYASEKEMHSKDGAQCRFAAASRLSERYTNRINRSKYVLVVQPQHYKAPEMRSMSYKGGHFKGKIHLYDMTNESLLGSFSASAASATSVSGKGYAALKKAVNRDFDWRLQDAIHTAIKAKLNVKGNLPKLEMTAQ